MPGETIDESGGVSEEEVQREIDDSISIRVSMERDLQSYLAEHLEELEPGLTLVSDGVEHTTEAGRIDILAKDSGQKLVVVELKAGRATDGALGQILGYMGYLAEDVRGSQGVRGVLVAAAFDQRVIFAARNLEGLRLVKYRMNFGCEEVT